MMPNRYAPSSQAHQADAFLNGKQVVLCVSNDLSHDQRLHRVCTTLVEAGAAVTLVGRRKKDSQPLPPQAYTTVRHKLPFERGKLFYLALMLRQLLYLLRSKADLFVANDLDTLLAVWLAARLRRKPFLYDAHEIFIEAPELVHRPRTRAVWARLEGWLLPRTPLMYTVNQSLADWYTQRYGLEARVVRNLPLPQPAPDTPASERAPLLLYQGMVNLGRGVDLMIRSLHHLPHAWTLWVVGGGDVLNEIKTLAQTEGLTERVRFWGPQPFAELPPITCQARIGLSLEEDRGLNYRNASPNKLVDYLQAGLGVVCADLPEMRRLVTTYGVGQVLHTRTPETLAQEILHVSDQLQDPDFQQAIQNARQQLTWRAEQNALLDCYQTALAGSL